MQGGARYLLIVLAPPPDEDDVLIEPDEAAGREAGAEEVLRVAVREVMGVDVRVAVGVEVRVVVGVEVRVAGVEIVRVVLGIPADCHLLVFVVAGRCVAVLVRVVLSVVAAGRVAVFDVAGVRVIWVLLFAVRLSILVVRMLLALLWSGVLRLALPKVRLLAGVRDAVVAGVRVVDVAARGVALGVGALAGLFAVALATSAGLALICRILLA